jgi:hypothetical protein
MFSDFQVKNQLINMAIPKTNPSPVELYDMIHYWFYHIEHLPAVKFLTQKTGVRGWKSPKRLPDRVTEGRTVVAQIFPRTESVVYVFSIAEIAGRDPKALSHDLLTV